MPLHSLRIQSPYASGTYKTPSATIQASFGHLPVTAMRQARHPAIHSMRPFILTLGYHAGRAHAASIRGAILDILAVK